VVRSWWQLLLLARCRGSRQHRGPGRVGARRRAAHRLRTGSSSSAIVSRAVRWLSRLVGRWRTASGNGSSPGVWV